MIGKYLKNKIHLRARAEYSGRDDKNGIYLQGIMSLQQALKAFQTFGEVDLIQQYIKGKRVTIWTDKKEWSMLEKRLNRD